jgi:hypothetical protein
MLPPLLVVREGHTEKGHRSRVTGLSVSNIVCWLCGSYCLAIRQLRFSSF